MWIGLLIFHVAIVTARTITNLATPSINDRTFALTNRACFARRGQEGVCMFQYDCRRQKGTMLATCLNGIFFGTCCQLPKTINEATTAVQDDANLENLVTSSESVSIVTWNHVEDDTSFPSSFISTTAGLTSTPTSAPTTESLDAYIEEFLDDVLNMTSSILPPLDEDETTMNPVLSAETTTAASNASFYDYFEYGDESAGSEGQEDVPQVVGHDGTENDLPSLDQTVSPTTLRPTTTTIPTTTTTVTTTTVTTTVLPLKISTIKPFNYKRDCGVRPLIPNGRIVGGTNSRLGEWPWQVLVKEATWLGLFVKNKCGGVLLNHNYVITAAHCQPGFLASLIVVFGESDLNSANNNYRSLQRNVRRVIVHRKYNGLTFDNDLALLELERPVDYQPHIVPICLPPENSDFTGSMAIVSGWGRLKYGGRLPTQLQYVEVPIITNNKCQQMFLTAGHVKSIGQNFICAGYEDGGKDSCEGDSGGPLMLERDDGRWILVGTVSNGIKCAYPNLPGIYMRIAAYRKWIENTINN